MSVYRQSLCEAVGMAVVWIIGVSAVSLLSYAFCRREDDPRLVGIWLQVGLFAVLIGLIAAVVIAVKLLFCRVAYACGPLGRVVANVVYWPFLVSGVLGIVAALACSGYWFGNVVAPYVSTHIAQSCCWLEYEWFIGIPVNDEKLFHMTRYVEFLISLFLGFVGLALGSYGVDDFVEATRPSELA